MPSIRDATGNAQNHTKKEHKRFTYFFALACSWSQWRLENSGASACAPGPAHSLQRKLKASKRIKCSKQENSFFYFITRGHGRNSFFFPLARSASKQGGSAAVAAAAVVLFSGPREHFFCRFRSTIGPIVPGGVTARVPFPGLCFLCVHRRVPPHIFLPKTRRDNRDGIWHLPQDC